MRNALYKSTTLSAIALAGVACVGTAQPAEAQMAGAFDCVGQIINNTIAVNVEPSRPEGYLTSNGTVTAQVGLFTSTGYHIINLGSINWNNAYFPNNGAPDEQANIPTRYCDAIHDAVSLITSAMNTTYSSEGFSCAYPQGKRI